MTKWKKSKAGTGNQYTLKCNNSTHVVYKSNGGWGHTEWDAGCNRIDRGKVFGTLAEAKAYIEEWYA